MNENYSNYWDDFVNHEITIMDNLKSLSINKKIKLLNIIYTIVCNLNNTNTQKLLSDLVIDKTEIIAQFKEEWEKEHGIKEEEPVGKKLNEKKKKGKDIDEEGSSLFVSSLLS